VIESLPIIVVKKDKSREQFDRNKLFNSMMRACETRTVSLEAVEQAVDAIESTLQNTLDREVSSMQIGELAMEQLKKLDQVAYVRFASVYRQFRDINTFMDELNKLLSDK
jgi:transcriptional repressor NrdR